MPLLRHKYSWCKKGQIFKLQKSTENLRLRLRRSPAKGSSVAGDTVANAGAEQTWVLPESYARSAAATGARPPCALETSLTGRQIFTVSKEMKSKPPS